MQNYDEDNNEIYKIQEIPDAPIKNLARLKRQIDRGFEKFLERRGLKNIHSYSGDFKYGKQAKGATFESFD